MAKDQATPVNDIAKDDQKLKEKATELVRESGGLEQVLC